jgi:hypothetical protein
MTRQNTHAPPTFNPSYWTDCLSHERHDDFTQGNIQLEHGKHSFVHGMAVTMQTV